MKQRCIVENGHLYYERLIPPRFIVEVVKDDEGYMFDYSTLIYADKKQYDTLFLALVVCDAMNFIASYIYCTK